MSKGSKIAIARDEKNFSQAKLAKLVGVSQKTISAWEKDTRGLSADQLKQLAEVLGKPAGFFLGSSDGLGVKEHVKIPICEVEASAGHGCINETEAVENYLMIDRDTIRGELQCNPDHLVIIRVRGDSMTPTIKPGEMVVLDRSVNQIVSDGLYVMRLHDDVIVVKRLQALPGGKINVISDNKAYPPYQADLLNCEGLAIVGRVMAIIAMEKVGA